jgi:hypothetical protein
MKFPGICFAILCSVVICPLLLSGQASPSPSTAPQDLYPDQGYLSATRYTNRYFGFAFDLPADVRLEPVPQPVARDGRIQMLQLAGPPPAYAVVSIVALPLRAKTAPDAKAILRKALEQELFYGVEELHALSKTTLAGHLFYFYETRRGADQHMALATSLDGYAVLAVLAANNEKTVKELETSFQHLTFIAPAQVRAYAGADAYEYEGPAISSHRLARLQADPPANHIDAGKLSGNLYENQGLGFSYRIPPGWTLESEGAVQPAIERSRKRDDERPWMGEGERELMKACGRTLFSAWAKRPGTDGELSYDDFGEVTVTATSASCFPGIKFPASSADRQAIKDFLLQFGFTHPVLRDMRDARAFTSGVSVVVFLRGTVAFQVPGDELSRRLSIAIAVTSRRGYFLTWFFAAPHDSELRELLDEKVSFDAEPLNRDAIATKPGGGANLSPNSQTLAPALADVVPSEAQPVAASARAPSSSAQAGAGQSSAGTTSAAGPTKQQDAPDTTASSPPTLLRPGETIEDQQVKGKPLPQQPH